MKLPTKFDNKISKVISPKAKNMLRGLMGETDSRAYRKSLKKIKRITNQHDYRVVINTLRSDFLFKDNPLCRNFNTTCPKANIKIADFTERCILESINLEHEKLLGILSFYIDLLESINSQNYFETITIFEQIIENEGVSCFLIRMFFFVRNHVEQDENYILLETKIDELLIKVQLSNLDYLESAIKELSSPRTDFFNICDKINNTNEDVPIYHIAKSFISHICKDNDEFLNTLNAYYAVSLVDAFLYYSSISRLNHSYAQHIQLLNRELTDIFTRLSSISFDYDSFYYHKDNGTDLDFYRESFLLIELDDLFTYKIAQQALYNKDELKLKHRSPIEKRLLNSYFGKIKSIDDLRYKDCERFQINLKEFQPETAGYLENSNGLLYLVEKNIEHILENEDKFVELMSFTMDIGLTFPLQYLKDIELHTKSDDLRLVIACLISIKDKGQIAEHSLRRVIQDVTVSKYESKIRNLIESVHEISPSVTEHLISICDETFLSKLFQITDIPNRAIEDRADILEWYGKKTDDQLFIERAKNLRIDIQISKEKGTIDDYRIYVDPLKFTQWINDKILNDFTILLESMPTDLTSIKVGWDKVQSGVSVSDQIAATLSQCYDTFCNNKLFGIASYLGRRIRHGTIKGTGLKEIMELADSQYHSACFDNLGFKESHKNWLTAYETMLDDFVKKLLFIRSKRKPDGLIISNLNTNSKKLLADRLFLDIYKSFVMKGNAAEVPYLITEYCWRFIEEDLSHIKKFLMECKANYGVFKYDCSKLSYYERKSIQSYCQELNSLTAEKFRVISSWFNKPSIASPSADLVLLFKAVISEIKGYFSEFEPEVIIDKKDFVLSGGIYFVFYDALYVLIFNAAKYGKTKSKIEFKIDFDVETKLLDIIVTSEVVSDSKLTEAKKLINEALQQDFENAHVIEGRSGIKKLNRMEKDGYIQNVKFSFKDKRIQASFKFKLAY